MQRCWWLISFIALLFISHNNLYSQIDNWLDYSLDCDVYGCKGSKVIDLRHITNGVYYLIINGDVTKTKRFVIVK